ncbi:MAG: hypothetical protein PHV36_07345 [Elusimicrobiales bacterium]|nr:hypothetical protein [Elusimicrobiales bacterium]
MKTLMVLACLFALGVGPLQAQKAGDFGAGIVLGNQTGATAKFWLDGSKALDAGLGFNDNLTLYGDYLWHSLRVFPQPEAGKIPAYIGLGAQIGNSSHNDSSFGLRAVAGVAYWLPRNPLEIFLELVPVVHFSNHGGTDINMDLGLRYYF